MQNLADLLWGDTSSLATTVPPPQPAIPSLANSRKREAIMMKKGLRRIKTPVGEWVRRNHRLREAKRAKKAAAESDSAAINRMRGELEARNKKIRQEIEENEAVDDMMDIRV
ncbi:hypothetical protein N7520_004216 [Penicillium odoratum]|uniref:uncharacterized protein n=1 Tax=Penicillium odoratum TaxID=1167516 RepID=UPI0025487882|nr:uncharacterized protein N7520_004216 [Penicillium odoratum]KAJ5769657.1 hypothetical protein N7520_004216 [Penicillium odoratum]